MTTAATTPSQRIVEIVETCDGTVARTCYGIYDAEFDMWMSEEPFDGMIWTRDVKRWQEFSSREDAEKELERFQEWCEEQEENWA
jgi:hypothetical protein